MLTKNLLLFVIGLSGGGIVAAGVFAFITMLTIVPRIVVRTRTAMHIKKYENFIVLGGVTGNIISIYSLHIPIGMLGMGIYGFCAGIFVGCLAMSLAEVLRVIPIFAMRIKLIKGLPFVILSIAIGKMLATLFQLYYK